MAINTLPRRLPSSRVSGGEAVPLFSVVGLGILALFLGLSLAGGYLFHYAWDVVVLHTFRSAPHINIAQSIGLAMIVTYYTYSPSSSKESGTWTPVATAGARILLFWFSIYILHFFIPGA